MSDGAGRSNLARIIFGDGFFGKNLKKRRFYSESRVMLSLVNVINLLM